MLQKQFFFFFFFLDEAVILSFGSNFFAFVKLTLRIRTCKIMGDELLLNFGAKFQRLYYYMRNFSNLIGLEQW